MELFDFILLQSILKEDYVRSQPRRINIMGYHPNDYEGEEIRAEAHGVKQDTQDPILRNISIQSIANYICDNGIFDENDTIIPAPQHTGHAEYTLKIAKQIAARTGCKVCDCLSVIPRDTLYNLKKQGKSIEDDTMAMKKIKIPGKRIWFLDNIIATGHTFKKAKELIPNLIPLPYAVSRFATIKQVGNNDFDIDYEALKKEKL